MTASFSWSKTKEPPPKNEEEAEKVAKGLVPFEGGWTSKRRRDATLEKPPHSKCRKRLKVAEEVLGDLKDPYLEGYLQLSRAMIDFFSFKPAEALVGLEQAETMFRDQCPDAGWELVNIHMLILQCLTMTGQMRRLAEATRAYSQETRQRGDLLGLASIVTHGAAYVHVAEDDPDGGLAAIDDVMALIPRNGAYIQHLHAFNARSILIQYRGDADAAEQAQPWVEELEKPFIYKARIVRMTVVMQHLQMLTCSAARAEGTRQRELVAQIERNARWLARQNNPMMIGIAGLIRARLRGMEDRPEELLAELKASLVYLEECGVVAAGHRYAIARLEGDDEKLVTIEAALVEDGVRNVPRYLAQTGAGAF